MNPHFIIGTSYFCGPKSGSQWFFEELWKPAVQALFRPPNKTFPQDVFCVSVAGMMAKSLREWIQVIYLTGDLGHVHQLIGKKNPPKDSQMSSWEAAVLTLAMIAFTNECDLIFLEQDCLAFGPWIDQLYSELGDKQMLFGRSRCMPCAQSLFIVRHKFLLTFVEEYIQAGLNLKMGEEKFMSLMRNRPGQIGQFSFPFDRDRPLNFDLPVFYGQKYSPHELNELKRRKLISYDSMPEDVPKFTNDAL
jgi:hypothetical protein